MIPFMETISAAAPEIQIYFTNGQVEQADILNDIVVNKPTIGQVNQRLLALKLRNKENAKQAGQQVRLRLAAEQQQEVQATTEAVTEITLNVLVALATKQTGLVRSQRMFLAANPRYAHQAQRIRVIKCTRVDRSYSCVLT